MRIIAGVAGGRRLAAPDGTSTRPTSDRVREAIFNILGPPPPGARVLDLFAGSGALALEALSRGAAHAVLVERAPEPARLIAENAAALGFTDAVRIVRADVLAALPRLAARGGSSGSARGGAEGPLIETAFAWIFVDPPYARAGARPAPDLAARALALLGADDAPLVAPDGVVVVEHDRRLAPPEVAGALARDDVRRYGDTEVSFYRRAR